MITIYWEAVLALIWLIFTVITFILYGFEYCDLSKLWEIFTGICVVFYSIYTIVEIFKHVKIV